MRLTPWALTQPLCVCVCLSLSVSLCLLCLSLSVRVCGSPACTSLAMVHGSSQDLQAYLTSLLTDERVKAICRHRVLCRTLAGNCCDLLTVTNFGVSQAEMETRKVRMGQRWWWWWWWWWHGFHCVGLEEMGNFFSLQVQWRQKAAESSKLPPLWLRASHLISSQLWEGGGGEGCFPFSHVLINSCGPLSLSTCAGCCTPAL